MQGMPSHIFCLSFFFAISIKLLREFNLIGYFYPRIYFSNMNDYRTIFQKRANDYHTAMQLYPNVRFHEFNHLISGCDFSGVTTILDVPSGGGYLKPYIPNHVTVHFADFSEGFTKEAVQIVTPEELPFKNNSFDAVFSLSGMHHLKNVSQFVHECIRVTSVGGEFVFADVKKDTNVAIFLNEFVNEYNSSGHYGDFFTENYFDIHPTLQNYNIVVQYHEYPFVFSDSHEMIHFFKLFFGLDKADHTIIYEGIHDILGLKNTSKGLEVNWGLLQFKIKK